MDIEIQEFAAPAPIKWNYEDIRRELEEKTKLYETVVYSPDQVKAAKKDKAELNKLKKALNDKRKEKEREYMAPFTTFKKQVDDLIGLVDKPVQAIDGQLKAYEEQRKAEKADEIKKIFISVEHPDWLTLEQIENPKWLNATYGEEVIKDDISLTVATIKGCLNTLSDMDFAFEATEVYKRTLDMNAAITEGKRLLDMQIRKKNEEERRRQEEERRQEAQKATENAPEKPEEPETLEKLKEAPKEQKAPVAQAAAPQSSSGWHRFSMLLTDSQYESLLGWARDNHVLMMEED